METLVRSKIDPPDIIAIALSLLAIVVTAWISLHIFEGIAHLEDEFAYIWQAQVIARGELVTPSPPEPKSFLVPFVVDYHGLRFGKYPLGWPALLALGERLGLRWLVNPLLAGLGVWLTYRLGSKILGKTVGLLAAGLTLTSPFFLMNSGGLLSHPWGLVLSTAFVIAWLDIWLGDSLPAWIPPLTAGLTLGMLVLSRPLTALAVAIPFGFMGLVVLLRGPAALRKKVLLVALVTLLVGSLHFVWQYAVTGDSQLNPYTLWWEYDRVGFGPGVGVARSGHTLQIAWRNLKFSMNSGYSDLFGWWKFSWLFLPLGLWAVRRKPWTWLVASVFPMLVLLYMAYWVGAWILGPRYYYEGLFALTILTGAGIAWLAGWPLDNATPFPRYQGSRRYRPLAVTALVAVLLAANLVYYTPSRIGAMYGFLGTSRQQLAPFQDPAALAQTPALVFVDTDEWRAYAGLLELANPMLDSPYIFVWSYGEKVDARVMAAFPDRNVLYYNPAHPGVLYKIER
jgi:hypothetical protein